MKREVISICAGKAGPFRNGEASAIAKQPVAGPVRILKDGLEPDEQADRNVHGGPEMAIHLYPQDHHAFWETELGGHALLREPGAFGSNLAVSGITEDHVHIGDRFQLGSALLEISQPRQPCWKIEHRFDRKGMVATIVRTSHCGWYFRVLEDGEAQAGDTLERVEPGATDWSVARVFSAIFSGKGTEEELLAISSIETLAPKVRAKAVSKIEQAS